MGDGIHVRAWPHHTDIPPSFNGDITIDLGWPGGAFGMKRYCLDRHDMAINLLFMDSSTRNVRLRDLWSLKWNEGFDTTFQPDFSKDAPWIK